MKKKKQLRRKKRQQRNKKTVKVNTKLIVAVCTFLFSGLMVLGSTYAWFVSEDSEVNHFVGSRLAAEIVEEFEPEFEWQPGVDTKKVIQVKNTGNLPAFVRISLYEYLLTFKIDTTDQTGNGNLATSSKEVLPTVDPKDTGSWQAAADAGGTYLREGKHVIAEKAIVPNVLTGTEMYKFKDSGRDKTELRWFQLNFPDNVYTTAPVKGTKDYWLYKDGYFYYSELLQPSEVSALVLKSVRLSSNAPNKFKGALYQLNPLMDAHDATKGLLSTWNIGNSGEIYDMYHDRLSD
ncbi:BsaA family SipW-dependent biofilm matrix protein [Enterococcus crotali]|uniref:BsaA family SipW-dependent biofilm matrix protein n=1 Tax=Enterococcus crotali TaxID=1453587 RepID=UPI00046E5CB5|nr:BsaA family SipW-dependent biofilm matrix protein [Enterococcus crotali]